MKFNAFRSFARPTGHLNAPGFLKRRRLEALIFLALFVLLFSLLGYKMGMAHMLNSIMHTAYELLTNTVFFIMAITVLTGALAKLFIEFGVLRLMEFVLRPLIRPLYNLPGVAALGSMLTFLSDNPAIMSLAHDRNFRSYFTERELVSLPNFATSFGMGLIVMTFMTGIGHFKGAAVGLLGAIAGGIIATRLMQSLCRKELPQPSKAQMAKQQQLADEEQIGFKSQGSYFQRFLNAILDGGKSGVELGLAIVPGVLIISTMVMLLTFGPKDPSVGYQGLAGEGVPIISWLAGKVGFIFEWLYGFSHPELIAFPVTSLGSAGAALSLMPRFMSEGLITGNEVAVFTSIGMCWSGFLSTHTAMYDTLGYRRLIGKDMVAQTVGGLSAGVVAHFAWLAFSLL